jgi:hypothetical protein
MVINNPNPIATPKIQKIPTPRFTIKWHDKKSSPKMGALINVRIIRSQDDFSFKISTVWAGCKIKFFINSSVVIVFTYTT